MPLELIDSTPGTIWEISPKSAVGGVNCWMNSGVISERAERASSSDPTGASAAAMEPEAADSTVTSSAALATLSGMARSCDGALGSTTIPFCVAGAKPLTVAWTSYFPGASSGVVKWPEASALTVTVAPVASFLISRTALGRLAPRGSRTVPLIVEGCCACARCGRTVMNVATIPKASASLPRLYKYKEPKLPPACLFLFSGTVGE